MDIKGKKYRLYYQKQGFHNRGGRTVLEKAGAIEGVLPLNRGTCSGRGSIFICHSGF